MKGCFIHIRMKEVKISENAFCYLQPSIMVMRFFGMVPVTCEFNNGNYILKISKTKIVFWYILAITLGGLAIFGVLWDSKKYRQEGKSLRVQKDIDVYINAFDISIIILSVVSVIFSSPVRMKYFMNALHCINKIDTIVREPISNAKRGRILLTVGIIFGHVVSLSGSIFDGQYHIRKSGSGSWILYLQCYGTMFFFYSAIFAQQVAYWSLVSCINKRLTLMNQVIMKLARRKNSYIERYFGNTKGRIQIENGTQNDFENLHLNTQNQYSTMKSNGKL
ncbi:hypothetical protein WA026_005209 [Henosepilachna vigintioctopunctata]|uniref:Gustatory receptor n=1 Tax=Henosepilachna vigintioctopunctata TaxID=420089 RepID=A0AAW1UKZ3_9CUCU